MAGNGDCSLQPPAAAVVVVSEVNSMEKGFLLKEHTLWQNMRSPSRNRSHPIFSLLAIHLLIRNSRDSCGKTSFSFLSFLCSCDGMKENDDETLTLMTTGLGEIKVMT